MSDIADKREPDLVFENPPGGEEFVSQEELEKQQAAEPQPKEKPTGPSMEELLEEQRKLQERLESSQSKGDEIAALREGMDRISRALATQQPQPVQQPGESNEDFAKRINDSFIEDPHRSVMEIWRKEAQPAFQQVMAQNLFYSRKLCEMSHPETFKQYSREIDEMAKSMDQRDPQVFEKAHNMVLATHMPEIEKNMESRIEARLMEKFKGEQELPTAPPAATPAQPAAPAYNPAAPPVQTQTRTRVVYNATQRQKAEQIALAKYGSPGEWQRIIRSANNMVKGGRAADMDDAIRRLR